MLKRIFIDLVIVLGVVALAFGSFSGYLWLKGRSDRVKHRKEAEALVADFVTQRDALNSLGDVDLPIANLNLAVLEEKLHQPTLKKAGAHDSTTLGWACANENCAVTVSFAAPFGQEISSTAAPVALTLVKPFASVTHSLAVDGIQVGSKVEEIEKACQRRSYGALIRKNRITCGESWSVGWAGLSERADVLSFANEKLLSKVEGVANGETK